MLMSRSLVLFDTAALPAALAAAPVHASEQGNATFVMPISKNTKTFLPFQWPDLHPKSGGTPVSLRSIGEFCFDRVKTRAREVRFEPKLRLFGSCFAPQGNRLRQPAGLFQNL